VALNPQKGNMYEFVTHTWNPIKGLCEHDCSYCYMKRYPLKAVRLDSADLQTNLDPDGKDPQKNIFVGSSTDMFATAIPSFWISKVLSQCKKYNNAYLFQSKNPQRFLQFINQSPPISIFCTTMESNRFYPSYMGKSPDPKYRSAAMVEVHQALLKTMVTIEPIMEFDLDPFVALLEPIHPEQINIGVDTMDAGLPTPTKQHVMALVAELEKFTKVHIKENMYNYFTKGRRK